VQTVYVGDRYQICRRIGDGGMARVYLAWDTRLRLWCALKVMTPQAVEDEVLRTRFVHEGRALARLSHPNLVRFFDLVDDVQTPYMAMEYLEGGTVAGRLAMGPLPERQAAEVAADAASALQAAHDAGIVHRDIKPHNLLLDRHGVVKVSDFGVARVDRERRLTMVNMSLGTLAYMAPEQQRDAATVDHRVDVYALGATLWAMITGRRPTTLVSADRDRSLRLLSPLLEPIVRTATDGDRDRRYSTARELELALRDASARLPPVHVPVLTDPTLVPGHAAGGLGARGAAGRVHRHPAAVPRAGVGPRARGARVHRADDPPRRRAHRHDLPAGGPRARAPRRGRHEPVRGGHGGRRPGTVGAGLRWAVCGAVVSRGVAVLVAVSGQRSAVRAAAGSWQLAERAERNLAGPLRRLSDGPLTPAISHEGRGSPRGMVLD
jgi:tRNA A-37 threonylcarbamoyl transferase component Bud32